jgi:hypothetical protein
MGVRLTQTPDGQVHVTPEGRGDMKLAQRIGNLIRDTIREQEARDDDGKVEKSGTLTLPDGRVLTRKGEIIPILAKSAEQWEGRAAQYGLDPDVRTFLLSKSRAARDEIARLEGRDVPGPVAKQAEPVILTLPR